MKPTVKYLVGYVVSVALTLAAYLVVTGHFIEASVTVAIIVALTLIQLAIQLIFFLHLGEESRPRWKLWAFAAMVAVLLIVTIGSLWIMKNLDYHMMPQAETDRHMLKEGNKGF